MAEPLILAYNLDEMTASRLDALCRSHGIRLRTVTPGEYVLPIGALAGIPVSEPQKASPVIGFREPMLVLCHMLRPQLDAFLAAMRAKGLPRVVLKAVLTPYNVAWSSLQLRDELMREHEAVNTTLKSETGKDSSLRSE